MTSIFNYSELNNLNEFSFIAGSDQELVFYVYTSACALIDLSGASIEWKMYRYASPELTMLSKTGMISASPINKFTVKIDDTDTSGSQGKFIHMYSIVDASGSVLKGGYGYINILPYPN